MNKKTIILVIITLIFIASISTSIILHAINNNDENSTNKRTKNINNSVPIPIITSPEQAHFEQTIKFDATESYDPDGTIISFIWDFGDETITEGPIVHHSYKLYDNIIEEYSITYSIILTIMDNNESTEYATTEIKLYPSQYKLYFDSGKIITQKPNSNNDLIKATFGKIIPTQEKTYILEKPVKIQKSKWNATIYIEKPLFSIVNKITLSFSNKTGETIIEEESILSLLNFWKDKAITINGIIDNPIEFESIKIVVYGFSLRKKITIYYGGETASHMCFDFSNQ